MDKYLWQFYWDCDPLTMNIICEDCYNAKNNQGEDNE